MDEIDVHLCDVSRRFGDFVAVDSIDLEIRRGKFVTLLGPSGCGKTTTLRMIGGFERPDAGTIEVGGEPVRGSPFHHHTRMVFQSYALFPHMTVLENIRFGLKMARRPAPEIERNCADIIGLLGLEGHERKYPNQLSGGQQQRVALARALVTRPRVLLLDEPLGALDLKMRKRMQIELKKLQRDVGITFIYVTHDQEEAMNLSDEIVVMDRGRIVQTGTPEEIYRSPLTPYVADFIGETNLVEGTVSGHKGDDLMIESPFGDVIARPVGGLAVRKGDRVVIAVRPENLTMGDRAVGLCNSARGRVREIAFLGATTRVTIECKGVPLSVAHNGDFAAEPGEWVTVGFNREHVLAMAP